MNFNDAFVACTHDLFKWKKSCFFSQRKSFFNLKETHFLTNEPLQIRISKITENTLIYKN